ncbi:hypothetical protein BSLG_003769 [Batrachochytrium salamandrivorans]|nr:hypothetical protein BSLG_003769 [Batrachochytrium salamandrivorans]
MRPSKSNTTSSSKPPGMRPNQKAVLNSAINRRKWDKMVFDKQQILFDGVVTMETMLDSCRYLAPETYSEVVAERAADQQCGYPICEMHLQTSSSNPQFRISSSDRKVYDVSELRSFCSPECYAASKFLSSQLSSDPVYLRDMGKDLVLDLVPAMTKLTQVRSVSDMPVSVEDNVAEPSDPAALSLLSKKKIVHNYIDSLISSLPLLTLDDCSLPIIEKSDVATHTALDQDAMLDSTTATLSNSDGTATSNRDSQEVTEPTFDLIEGYRARSASTKLTDRKPVTARLLQSTSKLSWVGSSPRSVPVATENERSLASLDEQVSKLAVCKEPLTTLEPAPSMPLKTTPTNLNSDLSVEGKAETRSLPKRASQFLRFAEPIEACKSVTLGSAASVPSSTPELVRKTVETKPISILKHRDSKTTPLSAVVLMPAKPSVNSQQQITKTVVLENPMASDSKSMLENTPDEEEASDDDDTHSKASTDTMDFGWLKPSASTTTPFLSLFGRIWMILDRIVTFQTLQLLSEYKKGCQYVERGLFVYGRDVELLVRKNIFSEKMTKTAKLIRQGHKIDLDLEYELLCIVDTLNLGESTTVLSAVEEWMLCIVLMRGICDSMVEGGITIAPADINWTKVLEPAGMGNDELAALVRGIAMVQPTTGTLGGVVTN